MNIIFITIPEYLISTAIFLKERGHQVFFLKLSLSPEKNEKEIIEHLSENGVLPLPLESQQNFQISVIKGNYDPEMSVYNFSKSLIRQKLIQALKSSFCNCKGFDEKINVVIHSMVLQKTNAVYEPIILFSSANRDKKYTLIDPDISGFLLPPIAPNVKLIVLPVNLIASAFAFLINTFRRITGLFKFNINKNGKSKSPAGANNNEENRFKVAFIVHQGLSYGNLFEKDLFYSDNKDSEFYPEKILHLDYSGFSSPSKLLRWEQIGNHRQSGLKNIYNGLNIMGRGILHVRSLKHFIGLILLTRSYIAFQSFLKQLEEYPELRLALIDYEILCPKELLLACEAAGIRTVAAQERFIFSVNYLYGSTILNYYLCASPMFTKFMEKSPLYCIDHYIPVGQYRSDKLLQKKESEPPEILKEMIQNGNKIITALGFHTTLTWYESQLEKLINWSAHRVFIEDMIRLSQDVPEACIILRYKEIDWISLPVFADLMEKINSSEKIIISTDYSQPDISYDLCAHSDLVIAKHTSIADECLSVGIPVLFHEYSHNLNRIISDAFDYSPAKIMCYNYQDLLEKTNIIIDNSPNVMTEDYEYLKTHVYGGLGDGKVRERVHMYIEKLLPENSTGSKTHYIKMD